VLASGPCVAVSFGDLEVGTVAHLDPREIRA